MGIRIALAGNPNSGKTTLFNALTGANQFVGNWPGVTVEKKEGKLKKHSDVTITDLPGIYSLSPYTLEEVVARNYLLGEKPDAILNIIDGTNLERNLYLTTQLTELGIPVVVAINMMDVVNKNGDEINLGALEAELGCKVVAISALKGNGTAEAAAAAVEAAKNGKTVPMHKFSAEVEHVLAHIEERALSNMPEELQRWYGIKLFERDAKVLEDLKLPADVREHIENDITSVEKEMDDDSESIITNERYIYISKIIDRVYKKRNVGQLSVSDKIDRVVTNRILGLPIFAGIMFLVYFIAIGTVGSWATDWANDGLFGDGWFLFGIGRAEYDTATEEYGESLNVISAFADLQYDGQDITVYIDSESEDYDPKTAVSEVESYADSIITNDPDLTAGYTLEDEETLATEDVVYTTDDLQAAVKVFKAHGGQAPEPGAYGIWVPGIPVIVGNALDAVNANEVVRGLVLDGIVAGVGAVLGFVPQILVLFILLAFLEACGYMARIAFVLDRIFRKFGLSGKSFIPLLIGTGCGIPGIMASRTIENESDRRMTVMTTTFMPCGAKMPFIAMIAGAIFGGSPWIAALAYFIGIASVIVSGIMLKKTKMFAGDPAPFVMELPAYHWPTVGTVLRSMWERGWSFIKKAGTIILLSTIAIWFFTFFGVVNGTFTMLTEDQIDQSILANIGGGIAFIFAPLGWGIWQAAVAAITGLVAKENIVATMGIVFAGLGGSLYANIAGSFTPIAGMSFLVFNLLCAPCFAAMGAIKREMNNRKWFWFAIGYQCGFAYLIAFIIYQFGTMFTGVGNIIGFIIAILVVIWLIYMLVRPYKESTRLDYKAVKG